MNTNNRTVQEMIDRAKENALEYEEYLSRLSKAKAKDKNISRNSLGETKDEFDERIKKEEY